MQTIYPLGVGNSLNALLSTINTVNTAFLTNTASFVSAPGGATANQQSGGVWGRTVAGYADTKATSTNSFFLSAGPSTGTGTCTGTVHEEYVGSQFGFDLGTLNLGGNGANLHFGITGGYFNSKSKDLTGAGPANPTAFYALPEGKLSVDSQVPFAGVYAVYSPRVASSPTLSFASTGTRTLYRRVQRHLPGRPSTRSGVSVTANIGYNFKLPSDWFIEPSIGAVWSRVSVDDFIRTGRECGEADAPFPGTPAAAWTGNRSVR